MGNAHAAELRERHEARGQITETASSGAVITSDERNEVVETVSAASKSGAPQEPIAAAAPLRVLDPSQSVRITVIGAGRMGVAIGGELARRGAYVTFFDRTDFNRLRAMVALEAVLQAYFLCIFSSFCSLMRLLSPSQSLNVLSAHN